MTDYQTRLASKQLYKSAMNRLLTMLSKPIQVTEAEFILQAAGCNSYDAHQCRLILQEVGLISCDGSKVTRVGQS